VSRPFRLWVILVVVLATAGYVAARQKRDFWDFEVYRTAGVRILHAEPLYQSGDGHYQFKYWPAFALAMAPFAVLPVEVGKPVWFALTIALLAVFISRSIRALPDRRLAVRTLVWLTLLLTGKFIVKELVNGQTNVLLGVLIILAVVALEKRQAIRAGVLIGVAAFVKPYAIIFLPWLLATGPLAALAASLAVIGVGLVMPAAIYGWTGNVHLIAQWYATVTGTTPENLLLAENISFSTMWAKWIGVGTPASVLAVISSVAALAVVLAVWLMRRRVARPSYLEVSCLLLLVPLLSPQGWDYVLIVAIPAFVLLIDRFKAGSWPWKAIVLVGFFLTSLTVYDLNGRWLYLWLMAHSGVSAGAILLVGGAAHLRYRALA
jgi:hypothetical protein